MQLAGFKLLHDFMKQHLDIQGPLEAWIQEAREASWRTTLDIKARYASASFLSDNRVVFNVKGNKYRLMVKVGFSLQIVLIQRIGTHAEYDKWEIC